MPGQTVPLTSAPETGVKVSCPKHCHINLTQCTVSHFCACR